MQRTLQTSYNLFKNHPNIKNIKFKVVPLCYEVLDCTVNIPHDTLTSLKDEYSNKNGVKYDYSYF